jgi:uncharacterized membrane protein YhaH (DUF805 family)
MLGVAMIFLENLRAAMFGVFTYTGRSDRLEQWVFVFMTAVFCVGIAIFVKAGFQIRGLTLFGLLGLGVWILLAHISLCVRRLHDVGRTGFYMLLPLTGACVVLIGYIGENGLSSHFTEFLAANGWYIRRAGQSITFISATMLAGIFAQDGDAEPNQYGDPA